MNRGRLWLKAADVEAHRRDLLKRGSRKSRLAAAVLSPGVLEQQGFTLNAEGRLVFPQSCPGKDDIVRPGTVIPVEETTSGGTSRGGGGGESLSLAEAQEQVEVAREYDEWASHVRSIEVWERSRNHRMWVLGEWVLELAVRKKRALKAIREELAKEHAKNPDLVPEHAIEMFGAASMDAAFPDRAGRGR